MKAGDIIYGKGTDIDFMFELKGTALDSDKMERRIIPFSGSVVITDTKSPTGWKLSANRILMERGFREKVCSLASVEQLEVYNKLKTI